MWYPPIEPYEHGLIETGEGHRLYWEACGNPSGRPVLVIHGGPGGGSTPNSRRWFDPRRYRIILFDQRGCGRSTPTASIERNTTTHLVNDVETLRRRLTIERWTLMGRSWGTTLALAYAESHPQCVQHLVLCGVFLARRSELDWLYRGGAASLFPEAWTRFRRFVADHENVDVVAAYYRLLTSGDPLLEAAAAAEWCHWEDTLATGSPVRGQDDVTLARARIETHYFVHGAFLSEGQLTRHAYRLRGIPAVVIQGTEDRVTPPRAAADLCEAWPEASLHLIPGAGHQSTDPDIMRALVDVFDEDTIPLTPEALR